MTDTQFSQKTYEKECHAKFQIWSCNIIMQWLPFLNYAHGNENKLRSSSCHPVRRPRSSNLTQSGEWFAMHPFYMRGFAQPRCNKAVAQNLLSKAARHFSSVIWFFTGVHSLIAPHNLHQLDQSIIPRWECETATLYTLRIQTTKGEQCRDDRLGFHLFALLLSIFLLK